MKSIGIHLPDKAQFSDKSDYLFVEELEKTIRASGRYKPIRLKLKNLRLASIEDAGALIEKHNLCAVVQHDSAFYSTSPAYRANVDWLHKHVPFLNSLQSQEIGHDKITTKRILREQQIPVLDDEIIESPNALFEHMNDDALYVVKPHNNGAGSGVRLIRKRGDNLFAHINGKWRKTRAFRVANGKGIKLQRSQNVPTLVGVGALFIFTLLFPILFPNFALAAVFLLLITFYFFIETFERVYTYTPMLVEPYFNDNEQEFTSLRCTVIGNEVVEAVKRTNRKNITSNISSGGVAEKIELSARQKEIAVAAKNAIGADYAGVDLLVRGDESVVGEVNIGPFTLFCTYTGVNVGKIFGEYLIAKCDTIERF